jgi:uncharacterized protein (DUF433 family)
MTRIHNPARDAAMLDAHNRGLNQYQIAAEFGITQSAVCNALQRAGRKPQRQVCHVAAADIIAAVNDGMKDAEIAAKFGCKKEAVRHKRSEAGLKANRREFVVDAIDKAIIDEYNVGLKIRQIAENLCITMGRVAYSLKMQGYEPQRQGNHPDAATILAEYNGGLSVNEICNKYDMNYRLVYRLLKEAGYEPIKRDYRRDREEVRTVLNAVSLGCSVNEIARSLGRCRAFVESVIKDNRRAE